MSKTKRNHYAAEFKALIALEAIKGEQTVAELAQPQAPSVSIVVASIFQHETY